MIQRILVVQMSKDDPAQFTRLVNGIFVCQKSNITLDCLVLRDTAVSANEGSRGAEQRASI